MSGDSLTYDLGYDGDTCPESLQIDGVCRQAIEIHIPFSRNAAQKGQSQRALVEIGSVRKSLKTVSSTFPLPVRPTDRRKRQS